jgi:hypothetical protein
LCIASSNLYFSRKNRRSITRWNRPRATSESVKTTTTDIAATTAPVVVECGASRRSPISLPPTRSIPE